MNWRIENKFYEITKRMPSGKLYGEKIDTENIQYLIVSAYFLGKLDSDSSKDWKRIVEIFPLYRRTTFIDRFFEFIEEGG